MIQVLIPIDWMAVSEQLEKEVGDTKKNAGRIGLTVLPVKQNADAALNAANYVYIVHEGLIKAEGKPEDIKGSQDIREAYLGI